MVALAAGVVAVVAAALAVGAFVLRDGDEEGPGPTASAFAAAWSAGDVEALRRLVSEPAALDAVDPIALGANVGVSETRVEVGTVAENEGEAAASFSVVWTVGDVGEVTWDGELPLVEVDEVGWRVAWDGRAMHPSLPPGGSFSASMTWPERAPILGVGDQVLIGAVETIRIGIEPGRFDRVSSVPVLAEQLGLDPATIDAALDAPGVEPHHFVQIAEVRPDEFEAVRDVIFPIPGVLFPRGTARGGPTTGFARHLVGRHGEVTAERLAELGSPYGVGDRVGLDGLEARFEEQLAGRPAIEIVIVDAARATVELLASFAATAPQPVRTTIDPVMQAAAEAALAGVAVPAALVAVDAQTGEVRAAVSRPLDEPFNRAVGGAYPPGSTFKVVTAYALLASGVSLSTTVDCPVELVVDGRPFQNFEGGASGSIPFSQAFAESCNTAMIGAAQALPESSLGEAAGAFGFGVDYTIGPTTLGGSFPEPASPVERAAAAIGQAEVTASPLHMATLAAAVLDGTWRSPLLLPDAAAERHTRPLDPTVRDSLTQLMGLVVTEGSGTAAAVPGHVVIGKTGTAEFGEGDPLPTHAWFIAGADGLGIAVVLEGGGVGGRDAAPIAARFIERIPAG